MHIYLFLFYILDDIIVSLFIIVTYEFYYLKKKKYLVMKQNISKNIKKTIQIHRFVISL